MSLDVAAVMTEAGDLLKAISGLRVLDYEAPTVSGVTAIVGYPDEITYNQQYGPEGFRFDLPIVLVAPNPTDRRTRDVLSAYVATAGDASVKVAIEDAGDYTNMDTATVKSVTFDEVTINNVQYAGALFVVDIAGH